MNINGIDWQHPLEVPVVEMGTEKEFWIAVYSEQSKRQHVFLAHYQNRPLVHDDDGELIENDWYLDGHGELVDSVGWVEHTRHDEYDNYYTKIGFSEDYRLLGWAEYEPPRFVAVDLADGPDVGVVFNYDPDLEKPELPISKFKICQLKMCAAIAEELSRQCPDITTEQSQMAAIIEGANLVCDAVNNQAHKKAPQTVKIGTVRGDLTIEL
ncbi:Phage protein [Vibrio crassostreae]|nr:Phage protein [Vibrio crassostreae]CAK3508360.1 Phage protein [Vibrio crassostreae]CAK3524443.1 Phage protein [Vibrio crassostreae]